MKILYSKKFKNSFKNIVSRHPKMKEKIEKVIFDFENKLYDSEYFRKNFFDWRVLIEVIVLENEIKLLNIWTHSSLELSSNKKLKI